MANLNKVTLIGRLGNDPELKYTQSGIPVVKFSFATSEAWTDRDGQRQEETEWHKIVVWNKAAENVAKFLKKGSQAYVEGKLKTESWDDKQTGKKAYQTTIVASAIQFLDSPQKGKPAEQPRQDDQRVTNVDLEQIPF